MVSGSFSYSDTADETLTQLAQRHPEAAMAEIGKWMLDEQQAWTFFAAKFHIFTKLPEEIVTAWLRVHGVEAARTIARHLPAPTLDGRPAEVSGQDADDLTDSGGLAVRALD